MPEKSLDDVVARLQADLQTTKEQLIEAHKMRSMGELLAGIIHEINTPIGSILSNNEVASRSLDKLHQLLEEAREKQKPPPPQSLQVTETLRNLASVDKIACERIAAVVRGLKTFAGGSRGAEHRKANLNEVLDDTLKLAHCEFRRRIQVETSYGDIPEVECDPHQVGQVFLNLLVNAGHAIAGEGVVKVRTELEGDRVHIAIADNGCGIPEEFREKIFTSGFTTKPAGIGTGLGLAISKEIIEVAHGGSIDFESEAGQGTTFHIRIPVSRPPDGGGA